MRNAIDAGLRAFCSETGDFDMSSGMRRAAVDHIMGQPGMFSWTGGSGPMVEKMARAIWANRREYLGSWQGQAHVRNQELEHADAGERKRVYQDARAALTAMLEPSAAIIQHIRWGVEADSPLDTDEGARDVFVKAIQAALDEDAPC